MHTPWRAAVLALAAALTLCASAQAQQPGSAKPSPAQPYVFQTQSNLVNLTLVATDPKGRPVTDLKASDFVVLENGKPQRLLSFEPAHLDLAVAAKAGTNTAAPTAIRLPPEATSPNAGGVHRYLLFVIDSSTTEYRARKAAIRAVRRWLDSNPHTEDLIGIASMRESVTLDQMFTSDRPKLYRAIASIENSAPAIRGTERTNELLTQLNSCTDLPTLDLQKDCANREVAQFAVEGREDLRATITSIASLLDILASFPGEKHMVYLGHGFYSNPGEIGYDAYRAYFGETPELRGMFDANDESSLAELSTAALRASTTIYTVDPAGLESSFESEVSRVVPLTIGGHAPTGVEIHQANPTAGTAVGAPTAWNGPAFTQDLFVERERQRQQSLIALAEDTGGKAYFNSNDIGSLLTQAVGEQPGLYYASYSPRGSRLDGSFRRISIAVRRPGVSVRTRKGYYARRVRALPLDVAVMAATPIGGGRFRVGVRCSMPASSLAWKRDQYRKHDSVVVVRSLKRWPHNLVFSRAEVLSVSSALDGDTFEYAMDLLLPPGAYTYSISFTEVRTGNYATTELPIMAGLN
jgi:VWFA-related protein